MLPLLFFSCQKDDDFQSTSTQESSLRVRELHKSEIQDIKSLSPKLREFNTPPRTAYSEDTSEEGPSPVKDHFKIDDSYAKEVVADNYTSYTFQMLPRKGKRNLSQLINIVYTEK